jgi:hypothetical protein
MRLTVIVLSLLTCGFLYDLKSYHATHPKLSHQTSSAQCDRQRITRSVDACAIIRNAARKHNVPVAFVQSIVAAESNFDPAAVSARGAVGLMQLMPQTASQFGANAAIPEENIDAGTQYLGWLLKRYSKYRNGMSRAIAAYNAGPAVVDKYRGVPPYQETRNYVTRVLTFFRQYQKNPGPQRIITTPDVPTATLASTE